MTSKVAFGLISPERHEKSANFLLLGEAMRAMRAIRNDRSKIIKPKKKTNAKVKTDKLQANLKLTHWYEKAALAISAAK